MSILTENIYQAAEFGGDIANPDAYYIGFYGWFTPGGADGALGSVSASDVFGTASYIPSLRHAADDIPDMLTGSIGYQAVVIALFLLYFFMVFRFGRDILNSIRLFASPSDHSRHSDNENAGAEVVAGLAACGLLTAGIAVVRMTTLWSGEYVLSFLPDSVQWLSIPITAAALLVILLLQSIILRSAGALTFSGPFIKTLMIRRRGFLITSTVLCTPIALLLAMSQGLWVDIFAWAFAVAAALLTTGYVVKSFLLFVEQKVSILFWFLYLCAVEMMPFAIVVTVIIKNMAN